MIYKNKTGNKRIQCKTQNNVTAGLSPRVIMPLRNSLQRSSLSSFLPLQPSAGHAATLDAVKLHANMNKLAENFEDVTKTILATVVLTSLNAK